MLDVILSLFSSIGTGVLIVIAVAIVGFFALFLATIIKEGISDRRKERVRKVLIEKMTPEQAYEVYARGYYPFNKENRNEFDPTR